MRDSTPRSQVPGRRPPRAILRNLPRWAAVWVAAIGASLAQAGPGAAQACSPAIVSPSASLWTAGDFDGDNSVDFARVSVLRRSGGSVLTSGVDFYAFCRKSIPPVFDFSSSRPLGLVFSARDIDSDNDLDLVLRDPLAGKAIGVWLNDGAGGFSATEPAAFPGAGKDSPTLQKRAAPLQFLAPCTLSKTYASLTASGGPIQFLPPGSRRSAIESPANTATVWRSARRPRAPPVLSFHV